MFKINTFNRTLVSALFSVVLIILTGFIRTAIKLPEPETDRISDWFWLQKVMGESNYDFVMIGDSRLYRGLASEEISSILHSRSVINLGFSSGGLNPQIFQLAQKKLNPKSPQKIILIAVSPYSLTSASLTNRHYLELKEMEKQLLPWQKWKSYAKITKFFEPMNFSDFKYLVVKANKPKVRYIQIARAGGWIASNRIPPDQKLALESYQKLFSQEHINQDLVLALISQVRIWRKQGICIYTVRIPTSIPMQVLEDKLSGFDEKSIKKQLEQAGGIWLDIPGNKKYYSYDGSHLDEQSSRQFSRDLAEIIKVNPCN